jgi:thioredoxin 1
MLSSRRYLLILAIAWLLLGPTLPALGQAPEPHSSLPQILEFDRKLCPICKEAEGIIQALQVQHPGKFGVQRLYIDEVFSLFRLYKVAIAPTQVFLDASGKEVFRHEGVFPRNQLEQKLRELEFIR